METGQQRAAEMIGKPERSGRARPHGTKMIRSFSTKRRGVNTGEGEEMRAAGAQGHLKLGESCFHHSEFWDSFPMGIQKAAKIVLGCSLCFLVATVKFSQQAGRSFSSCFHGLRFSEATSQTRCMSSFYLTQTQSGLDVVCG